jgi:peptidoglycan hydrolase-like protein with peptidoglycan-binding domain
MSRNLAEGMFGIDVKAIQQALNIWMSDRTPLVDDGKFGPLTRAAVIAFQSRSKLKPDGIVGPLTLTALYPVAPYHGVSVVARGAGPIAASRSASTGFLAAPAGSLALETIPGLPLPVPIPRAPTNKLANVPGLPPQHRQRISQPSPPSSGGIQFQSTQYQFGTTTTWPLDFSKPGVAGLQVTVKGLFLLDGKALTLAVGGTGTVAVSDGAKDVAAGICQVAWAPSFLKDGDLVSLSAIAQIGAGVLKIKGKDTGGAFFHQEALNLKLGFLKDNRLFFQGGITLTQDENTGNLGLHAPTPGFGIAAGFTFSTP